MYEYENFNYNPRKMAEIHNKVTSDNHRINNVWDITFDTKIDIDDFNGISVYDINEIAKKHKQFQCYIIDLSYVDLNENEQTLDNVKKKSERIYIKDIQFNTCDFIGSNNGKKITFRNCTFEKSYFGYSTLTDVNFENCTFNSSSFALTKFFRCRFDHNCNFNLISISGGKTVFTESVISPDKFINSIFKYATKEYCLNNPSKNIDAEKSMMFTSMVKLSRNILESVSQNGDDAYYYNAAKQVHKLKIKERHYKKIWDIKKDKPSNWVKCILTKCRCALIYFAMPIENFILNALGFLNGWGASISRCALFGTSLLTLFSIIYFFSGMEPSQSHEDVLPHIIKSIIQSFDITFLAGYTKYVSAKDDYGTQLVCLLNMLLGLTWYAISIPTVINKISINRI
ncbi:pentapeptide repeat-containing protein [Enterobacter roggenkampii]|uniref:pentapeptide repeat-containing protein n=1 Tax=Enterobacter roggenkampii TaxID=1812935 RepID=UPI002004737D|nr:pentapeptide repeat-containing protein [Enterobacter roggenkampii]MCK7200547.1 pentapeptide repeat-containing protein [Enterobacter roggenkampii]